MSERELWQEVLLLAVNDALFGPPLDPTKPKKTRLRELEIQSARAYLTAPSKDLAFICSAAGIDMPAMIEKMKVRIAEAPSIVDLVEDRKKHRYAAPKPKRERKERKPSPSLQLVTVDDMTLTVEEWATRSGLKVQTVLCRLKNGWPPEVAVTTSVKEARRRASDEANRRISKSRGFPARRYTYNGETLTTEQWSKRTGISQNTIATRLRKGWPLEEVLRPGDRRVLVTH